jgi:Fe-Mn family superoxide dismutase
VSEITRRDVLIKSVPALALAGLAVGCTNALAQDTPKPNGAMQGRAGVVPLALAESYKDGQYVLPPLPYPADALEPHIDKETMLLHHDKHHKGYVDGLNKALKEVAELQSKGDSVSAEQLAGLQRNVSFNAGGHILHSTFWTIMAPNAGGDPADNSGVATAIKKAFGSVASFKSYFSKVAGGVKGCGWAILAYEPIGDGLVVTESGDQDLRMVPGATPLLLVDVWEHAYYLKYQNKRGDYIKAWWNVVNWPAVEENLKRVRTMHGQA